MLPFQPAGISVAVVVAAALVDLYSALHERL